MRTTVSGGRRPTTDCERPEVVFRQSVNSKPPDGNPAWEEGGGGRVSLRAPIVYYVATMQEECVVDIVVGSVVQSCSKSFNRSVAQYYW